MNSARFPVAVVMRRQNAAGRPASWRWEARGVTASDGGQPLSRTLHEEEGARLVLFDGHALELDRDHADHYVRNLSAPQPKVFVTWRLRDGEPLPHSFEVSCHEPVRHPVAAGPMDTMPMDTVPMPVGIADWVAEFVQVHCEPEPASGPDSHANSGRRPGHAAR